MFQPDTTTSIFEVADDIASVVDLEAITTPSSIGITDAMAQAGRPAAWTFMGPILTQPPFFDGYYFGPMNGDQGINLSIEAHQTPDVWSCQV